jgi:hypothetical protein
MPANISRSRAARPIRSFALVDCIVATVLLGVGLTVIIGVAGNALSGQSTGEHMQTAAMLADEQLQLILARGPDDYATHFATEGSCDEPFQDYKYKVTIVTGDPFQVGCTISWNVGSGEKSIHIDTLISSRSGSQDSQPDPVRTPRQSIDRNATTTTTTGTTTPTSGTSTP